MKQKLYSIYVEIGDVIPADNEQKAIQQFIKEHKGLTDKDIENIRCEDWDEVMKNIKSASSGK